MLNNQREVLFDVFLAIVVSTMIFISRLLLSYGEIYNYSLFVFVCILLYILIVKLLTYSYKKTYSQINLVKIFEYRQDSILFNHYLLPILLLLIIPLYLFLNNHYQSDIIVFLLACSIYFLHFTNLRSFFKSNFKLENKTHFIYDLLNILNYFFSIYVLLGFINYFNITRSLELFCLVLTEALFYYICFTRYYERIIKKLLIIASILIAFNFLIILIFNFSILKILVLTIGSYINFIIFNRKYLQQDYKLDKNDYSESLLIQMFSLGFALII